MILQYTELGMWWLCGFYGSNGQNGQDLFGGGKNAAGVHGKERTIRVRRGDGRLSAPEGARAFSGFWCTWRRRGRP